MRPSQAPQEGDHEAWFEPVDGRSLVAALAGTFVLRCASYGAGSIIPIFLGLRSRSDAEVTAGLASLVAVTFYAAELLTAPFFGALSDRFGRKPFMLLGPLFGGVAIQLLGLTSVIPVLALVRVLEGLSTASSAPATLGFLSSRTARSERLRGRVMGFYQAATVVGIAVGAALAGRLYDQFGALAFTLLALVYALALALFTLVRSRGRPPAPTARRGGILGRLLKRRVLRFAPAWLAANAVLGAWFSLGPFLAAGTPDPAQLLMGGFTPGEIGLAQLAFGVVFTVGAISWGYIMPLVGRHATLLSGVLGLGLTSFTLWILNHGAGQRPPVVTTLLVLLLVLGVFVESGFTPAALTYLAEIAEEQAQDRGSVMGLYSVLLSGGQLLGGALAGPFAQRMGINGLIVLTGLLSLVALFTVMLLGHAERRRARRRAIRAEVAG